MSKILREKGRQESLSCFQWFVARTMDTTMMTTIIKMEVPMMMRIYNKADKYDSAGQVEQRTFISFHLSDHAQL
jgi:hypothetical protein